MTIAIAGEEFQWDETTAEELYQALEEVIFDYELGGVADPLGQLVSWLWDQIRGALSSLEDTLRSLLDSILSTLEDLINSVSATLQEAISSLESGITTVFESAISSLQGFIQTLLESVQGTLSSLSDSFQSFASMFSDIISSLGNTILTAISGVIDQLTAILSTITDTLSSVANSIISAVSSVADSIGGMISSLASSLSGAISGLASTITSAFSSMVSSILSAIRAVEDAIRGITDRIVDSIRGIVDAISSTVSSLASIIESGFRQISDLISGIVGAFESALSDLGSMIGDAISKVVDTVREAIGGIVDRIQEGLKTVYEGVKTSIGTVVDTFAGAFSQLESFIANVFKSISIGLEEVIHGFMGFVNAISNLGSQMASWFGKIPEFFDWVYKNVKDFIDSAVEFFTKTIPEFFTKTIPKFFMEDLPKALSGAWDYLVKVTEPVWKPIHEFFNWVYDNLKSFIDSTIEFFTDTVPKFFTEDLPSVFEGAWKSLVDLTEPIWKPLQDFFSWVYENAKGFIDSAVEFFTETVPKFFTEDLPNAIGGWWESAQDWLWNNVFKPITEGWGWFVDQLRGAWDNIVNFFTGVGEALPEWAKFMLEFMQNPLGKMFEAVGGASKWLQENVFAPAWEWLKSNVVGPAWETLSGIWNALVDQFGRLMKDPIGTLSEKLGYVAQGLYGAIQATGDALGQFIRWIISFFIGLKDAVGEAVEPLVSSYFEQSSKAVAEYVKPHSPPEIGKHMEQIVKTLIYDRIDEIKKALQKHGQVEEGMITITGAIALGVLAAMGVLLTGGMIVDNLRPVGFPIGTWKTIRTLFNWSGGFFLTSSLSSSFLFFGIHPMLRRYWAKALRPVLPGPEQLTMMMFRESISEDSWKGHLAELGYIDEFIEGFREINRPLPSDEELARALYRQVITEEEYSKYMGWWGWRDEHQRMLLEVHRPLLSLETIVTNYFREKLDEKGLSTKILAYGYVSDDIDYIVESHRPLPTVDQLMNMRFRGQLTEEQVEKLIAWRGYHKDEPANIVKAFIETEKKIPPYSDLVTMVVREVITPTQFAQILRNQGFFEAGYWKEDGSFEQFEGVKIETYANITPGQDVSERRGKIEWSDAIYEMHWRLPPLSDVFEFFNRAAAGFIPEVKISGSLEEAVKNVEKYIATYATLWDYKPAKRKHYGVEMPVSDATMMRLLRFRMPTRIQQRFMRRWGLISEDEMKRFYVAIGLDPRLEITTAKGEKMKLIDALARAEFLQLIMEERTLARSAEIALFEYGFKVWDDVKTTLEKLYFQDEEINVLKLAAEDRRLRRLNQEKLDGLIDRYVDGVISKDEFDKELDKIVKDKELKGLIVEEAVRKRVANALRRVRKYADAQLESVFKRYEEGFMSKQEFERQVKELLSKVEITKEELDVLFDGAEARRIRNLQRLVLRALGAKLRRREIDKGAFIAQAKQAGIQEDFAKLYADIYSRREIAPETPLEDKIEDEIRWVATQVENTFVEGAMTEDQLKEALKQLGFSDKEIELRVLACKLRRDHNYRKLRARTFDVLLREQFEAQAKGVPAELITIDEYKSGMQELGFTMKEIIEKITQFMADKLKQKPPEWKPSLTMMAGV